METFCGTGHLTKALEVWDAEIDADYSAERI